MFKNILIATDGSKHAYKALDIAAKMAATWNADWTIIQTEQKNKIDLIVIGSRGLGSIKGILLGSVTGKVLQLASCPCLSVK